MQAIGGSPHKQAASLVPLFFALDAKDDTKLQSGSSVTRLLLHRSALLNSVWRLLRVSAPFTGTGNSPGLGGGEKRREKIS